MIVLLLTACSRAPDGPAEQSLDESSGPNVNVSAAPGVSLIYQYGFRLPVRFIAAAQETNASQCEAMGPAVCRISGMTYRVNRNRTATGTLELKLAPQAARQFGKQAVAAVVKQGGMLASTSISSEESGEIAASAQQQQASFDADRARIEKQLAQPGLSSGERRDLQAQLERLANATRDAQAVQRDMAGKLATTPMTLTYESGEVDQSLSDGPIVGAFKDGWANIVSGIAVIITILVTLLPWFGAAGLIFWLWRRLVRPVLFPKAPKVEE